ncbi:MAG TPA: acyl-CoA dehydrogenase family protein [Candidatus Binataceae bacterium]|nr:acyl-CoA dehydrogenase family protein [Candidatus Binataceae bacterium]
MSDSIQPAPLADRRIPRGNDWLSRAQLDAITPRELVKRATALKPLLAANSREAERLRRPVDEAWDALRASGIFYHFVPKIYGGLEFDIDTYIDAMMPLGEGCSSTGWVASFCVEHNWMLAHFSKQAQDETFGGGFPYIIAPGVTFPPGIMTAVEGGYRVTGRWKWGTGVMHADWVLASAILPNGSRPRIYFILVPAEQVDVIDTWHVDGMIGTGSNDIAMQDVFVPAHRVIDMKEMQDGTAPGCRMHSNPIYRMPMLPFLCVAAAIPAVGTARQAVKTYRDRLTSRVTIGMQSTQAERPAAQMRLARAQVLTSTAETIIRQAAREIVGLAERAEPAKVEERIELRCRIAYAVKFAREAIQTLVEAAGAGAHMLDDPLQRAFRDINMMSCHVVYDLDTALELHGRAMLGLPPNSVLV